MASVFVSYNRQSQEITKALVNDIELLGHAVWFDQQLGGGQIWWDQILARVRACDVFVFVMDPRALKSTACRSEYGYAAALRKPILPVLVSDEVSTRLLPPALSQIQSVDYRAPDHEAGLRLARAFTLVPPPRPLPDPLPPPPDAPVSYLGVLAAQVEATSPLSYEPQSTLVVDLSRSSRDPETADDARALLAALRRRDDLYAKIAEEIDELLRAPSHAPSLRSRASSSPPASIAHVSHQSVVPAAATTLATRSVRDRSIGVLVGAGAGAVVGAVTRALLARGGAAGPSVMASGALVGVAGAIAGGICWMSARRTVVAFAGCVLGFIGVEITAPDNADRLTYALLIGAPSGAILGAALGAVWERVRR